MKKIIVIVFLFAIYACGQGRIIRSVEFNDSLQAIRAAITTGDVALPDSVLFASDSTAQRTFSDLKYPNKSLSNLGATAVNVGIYPAITNVIALGNSSFQWQEIWSQSFNYHRFPGQYTQLLFTEPTANRSIYFPNASGIVALDSTIGDSIDARMGAVLDIDDLAVVRDYEPVMQDSSILLYSGGVWQIFDFGDAMANVIVSLPDSIIYTSEVAGDSIIGTSATLDSIITDYWAGTLQNARTKTSYDIINPALVDTFMIFWLDDAITIDSVKAESADSIKIQVNIDDPNEEVSTDLFASGGVLVNGVTTLTTFDDNILTADTKAYLYFTYIGDTATRLKLKIYWRYN